MKKFINKKLKQLFCSHNYDLIKKISSKDVLYRKEITCEVYNCKKCNKERLVII